MATYDTGDRMRIGDMEAKELAGKYDTPLYVINEETIKRNYRSLNENLGRNYKKIRIHYAMKANTNLNILRILQNEGSYFDAVSTGEVESALEAGIKPERILFTGTSVRTDEMKMLKEKGIRINFDSIEQFERYGKNFGVLDFASFRINIDFGAGHHSHCITSGKEVKFGIHDYKKAYEMARKAGVRNFGIHAHIGSGILDHKILVTAAQKLLDIAGELGKKSKIEFEFIDFGGGIGVPYKPEDAPFDVEKYSKEIIDLFREKCKKHDLNEPFFCIEPGRYICANSSFLLTRVNTIKKTPHKTFAGVDGGFNLLVRPAMYGSYHHIVVDGKENKKASKIYTVAGPLCESGDVFARDRKLPELEEGDLLIIMDAGAYGFSMSSQYNSRPRCAEVLVNGKKHEVVREKESSKDLIRGQKIATWL